MKHLLVVLLAAGPDGAAVYQKACAVCHDHSQQSRAPDRTAMKHLTPESILASLTSGTMVAASSSLSDAERLAVAEYLAGKPFSSELPADPRASQCRAGVRFDPGSGPAWNGWGIELTNTRFQPAAGARLTAEQAPKLKLKWAFGFPAANSAFAQPTVVGGRVFVGSATGAVYALDAQTGCTYWSFQAAAAVRTAISIGPHGERGSRRHAAYFGDVRATVYAVDAATGELLWKARVEEHRDARVVGAPALHAGRLYVPVSSWEEGPARDPGYECCKFRGSVVALEARTGALVWKTYSIPEEPKPTKKNKVGTQLWGPAGAAIWSAPTLDLKRKLVYVATGNAYTEPEAGTSDAVLALDMDSGKMKWARQLTSGDFFNLSCLAPDRANCTQPPGPDFDFGNSPILRPAGNGKHLLFLGQKSGMVYALDPDREGEPLWKVRVGKGSALGGVQWGPASDARALYVAVSDVLSGPAEAGGLHALDLATGDRLWSTRVKPGCTGQRWCTPAQSAAVTVIPGVVFSGAVDGHLRAYSTADGAVIWDFDTAQEFTTVNQVKARGGSLDGPGPTVVNGMVYVNSGYGYWYGKPGNVLLAFSVDGK